MAQMTMNALQEMLAATREQWEAMKAEPDLNFDRELEWAMQSCEKNDSNIKYALGNPDSVKTAFLNIASVGVTISPERKFAYILPRDNGMAYDVSYMGIIACAIKDGAIQWAQAKRVFANDVYEPTGYDTPPIHRRKPFAKPEERGELLGVYCVVKTSGNDYLTDEMTIEEINDIRARSPAWRGGKGPWKTDEGEMQKKTVVNRAHKYWPSSPRADRAIHYLNTRGEQGIDLASTETSLRDQWRAKVADATTQDALQAMLKEAREAFRVAEDMEGYGIIRDAIAARAEAIKPANAPTPAAAPAPTAAPAATPAPTPAPTAAPAATPTPTKAPAAARTPKPATAPKEPTVEELLAAGPGKVDKAGVLRLMAAAEAGATEADPWTKLEACGEFIDALPEGDINVLNQQYDKHLNALKAKFGE